MSGIFGVVGNSNCISDLYYGIDYHSHMGTEYGGIAYINEKGKIKRTIHTISNSQFKSKFDGTIKKINTSQGIGVISDSYPQPLSFEGKFGTFAVCYAGLITNREKLLNELIIKGIPFSEISHGKINTTELIASIINQGTSIIDGIETLYSKINGSISLLVLTKEGIYCARDKNGVTPLVIAEKEDSLAVAGESCAFPNLGYKIKKFLQPGEIVLIGKKGIETQKEGNTSSKICAFLWIYTGFPTSSYDGINVETVRENCGKYLAKRDDAEVDMVDGVPDSGTAHAIGYAIGSKKPYRRSLLKYTPGYGRSYTPPSQEVRDRIALMKLIANEDIIKDKRIVMCDDSIVRGTQLKNFTIKKLKNANAKEIHLRIACPPLMFPCIYNLSTRSTNELATRKAIRSIEGKDIEDVSEYIDQSSDKYQKMVDWISRDLGADSLKYMLLEDMIDALGVSKEKICTYCWNGKSVQKSLGSY
ncbi:MAG: amidophosphoribosyltransferase [Nanoarchaeota archaeon]|nr:amidophosphoribosyltransferase [Nanoarchaeota archaeon]